MDTIKQIILLFWVCMALAVPGPVTASGDEFARLEAGFKNFLTCELTRTQAPDLYRDLLKGQPAKVTMVNLHSVQQELGITILTGAVQCFAGAKYYTLYAVVGIQTLEDKEAVSYFTLRKEKFSILATELIRFPYMERCPWTRYWIKLD